MPKNINVALIGNPNTGKTSVFNLLTGLSQQVGNYPGVTVERKTGVCKLSSGQRAKISDLPGTYSLNASSLDESVVVEMLMDEESKDYPDVAVVVCDIENIKRNLLIFTQVKDLNIPTILVVNMADQMERKGISLDIAALEKKLHTKIVLMSARKKIGIAELKNAIENFEALSTKPCLDLSIVDQDYFKALEELYPKYSLYKIWLVITQGTKFSSITKKSIERVIDYQQIKSDGEIKRLQQRETIKRYQFINSVLKEALNIDINNAKGWRASLDRILIHKVWGYAIFLLILLFIFQVIYDWSGYPMDLIDEAFAWCSEQARALLPPGVFTDLLAEGIIPGLGGVVIFIPQITFLFLFISILEESGYMSRVVFLMDRIMRKFGLSGKSVVPLISGTACAIPAVMATRNIENWKKRLITILVVPFTTCSARLPVYLIIISLIIPEEKVFWIFGYQSLTLMFLYFIGFLFALLSSWILDRSFKTKTKEFFVIEMPNYKMPLFKNVIYNVIEKTKAFIVGAGQIILAISIILWVLASYGPGEKFANAEGFVTEQNLKLENPVEGEELESQIASFKLEHSFIGYMGKAIEPVVQPLGYDWKIGIAIISSFAAREVFVGTLATIYSVESEEEETIKNRMAAEINPKTGAALFNYATGMSLLLFYAFAMQCVSTIAIVKKETNGWKWPSIQFIFMSGIAYISALLVYQLLK